MRSEESLPTGLLSRANRNLIAVAMGVAALILYWLTLSPAAYPGGSAGLTVVCLGLEPRLTPVAPLWMSTVSLARFLPSGSAVYVLNLWSALCGALSVALLFRFLSRWVQKRIVPDGGLTDRSPHIAGLVAGLAGAFAFATSLPLWVASTRLSTITFHALLLLLAFNLQQDYEDAGDRWRPFVLALLCGAGCAESAIFLLVTPFFMIMLLLALYKKERCSWGRVAGLAVCTLLGASVYGLAASHFAGTEGFMLVGYSGRLAVVGRMLMFQLSELKAIFPRSGWVLVLVMVFIPWLVVQIEARSGFYKRNEVAAIIFHLVLILLVLPVQFNSSALPWSGTLPQERLPVLEMLLTAMTIGYLSAFWFLRFFETPDLRVNESVVSSRKQKENENNLKALRIMSGSIAAVLLLLLTLAAVKNSASASGRNAGFVDSYVNTLLDQLNPESWLVTDGSLDSLIRLAAYQKNRKIQLINLSAERNPLQIRQLCRLIETDPVFAGQPARYINAARLGCAAFLQDWLASGSGAASQVSFYAPPDLLFEAGLNARPDHLVFLGVKDLESLKKCPFLEDHRAFWADMEIILDGPVAGSWLNRLRAVLRRHVSMMSNNMGVLLEDLERPEEAYSAYMRALEFDADNFSAMLNRVVLTRSGVNPLEAEEAELAASEALKELKQRPGSRNLARFYGYVRVPGEFARQGSEWMRFGQPRMAEASLKRAVDLVPMHQKKQFLQRLAVLHLSNSNSKKSEKALQKVLKIAPKDSNALMGMVRVANMRQDHAAAREWLAKAADSGVSEMQITLETAKIEIAEGNYKQAQQRLHAITDAEPSFLEAWALQANLLLSQNKADVAERDILPRMQSVNPDKTPYITAVTEAYVLKAKGPDFYKRARERFLLALRLQPGSRSVLSEVLKIDYALRDQKASEQHAAAMLRLDRNDALANYIMGTLLIGSNDLPGAAEHLRRSVAASPSVPVLNDLAEVLRMQKQLEEAEEYIRKALELNPESPFALDTLACILIDAGRLSEARKTSDTAVSLAPQSLPLKITAVRIFALSGGDKVEGREMLRQINRYADQLSPQQRAQLEAVAEELRKR